MTSGSGGRMAGLLLILSAALSTGGTASPLPQQAGGPAMREAIDEAELERQVREIASSLRCPTCRSLSVYDSPAEMALEMRALIREQLLSGMSAEEIKAYYVERYGEWILLQPKATGFNLTVWVAPVLIVMGGLAFVLVTARRWVERGRRREAALFENPGREG